MLFNNVKSQSGASYWLASRGVRANSGIALFGPGLVFEADGMAGANINVLFDSVGHENDGGAAVRPVVVLKSEVSTDEVYKIDDQKDEIWNISVSWGGVS